MSFWWWYVVSGGGDGSSLYRYARGKSVVALVVAAVDMWWMCAGVVLTAQTWRVRA